jgi:hypothetical protein
VTVVLSASAGSTGSWAGSWGSGCVCCLARRARRSSLVEGEDGTITVWMARISSFVSLRVRVVLPSVSALFVVFRPRSLSPSPSLPVSARGASMLGALLRTWVPLCGVLPQYLLGSLRAYNARTISLPYLELFSWLYSTNCKYCTCLGTRFRYGELEACERIEYINHGSLLG